MNRAKQAFFYVVFSLLIVVLSKPAAAHILKSNGTVAVVLHISPDDDPIAGVKSDIYLDFNDKQKKVTAQSCDCSVSISQKGTPLYTEQLFSYGASTDTSTTFQYAFPTKGVYQISVSGSPKNDAGFERFSFVYDIRVGREVTQDINSEGTLGSINFIKNHIPHTIASGIVLAFFIFALIRQRTIKPKKT